MFKPILLQLDGYVTADRANKLGMALEIAEHQLNSPEFKEWFLAQKFTQLGEMTGKTQAEMYDRLMQPVMFNYHLKKKSFWKRFTSVIGWHSDDRNTKGDDIYTYIDRYDFMSVSDLASHLAHELSHSLGFDHAFNWSAERDFSAPYQIGNYVSKHAI